MYLCRCLLILHQGYFLASSQEYPQKEVAQPAASILHAKHLVPSVMPKRLSENDLELMGREYIDPDIGFFTFASNSRSIAERAAKALSYKPKGPTLWEILESDLLAFLA
jgi:hypothetical protein